MKWMFFIALFPGMLALAQEDLSVLLAKELKAHDLPALGAVVVHSNQVVAIGVAGVRKYGAKIPVTLADKWHAGSCTKAMTGVLAARLVDRGVLSWDDSLSKTFTNTAFAADVGGITLDQLLRHRSGLIANSPMQGFMSMMPKVPPSEQRAGLLTGTATGKLESKPGTEYLYSNVGYALAGQMAEEVAGTPWETLIKQEVFEPLGMSSVGYGPPCSATVIDQPWGHRTDGETVDPTPPFVNGIPVDNPMAIAPAGLVHLSLEDLGRWMNANLQQDPLLSPAAWKAVHRAKPGETYAYGWNRAKRGWAKGVTLSHSGSNTTNFMMIWLAPNREYGVAVVTNIAGPGVAGQVDGVIGKLIERAGLLE